MKKNRAEKIVVVQEREWNEQEAGEKKQIIEAIFGSRTGTDVVEDDCCCGGNAPPSGGKLSGK